MRQNTYPSFFISECLIGQSRLIYTSTTPALVKPVGVPVWLNCTRRAASRHPRSWLDTWWYDEEDCSATHAEEEGCYYWRDLAWIATRLRSSSAPESRMGMGCARGRRVSQTHLLAAQEIQQECHRQLWLNTIHIRGCRQLVQPSQWRKQDKVEGKRNEMVEFK
ncbi:hypothetical protein BJV78DRAFT_1235190 [Lactifluus subvellereus]|nr:hypothetical protein BJV78DRAFT_1235190 [Lactifluus subvellereus]